ncbi:MAG TPA: hypothetical protein VNM16_03885 [Bacillota bacterium]|nr:hypothetical protein [Bacillota bacterium]
MTQVQEDRPVLTPEELDALIEKLRQRLYAKREEFLRLLAELKSDEPHT